MNAEPEPVQIEDVSRIDLPGDPRMRPGGGEILFTLTRQSREENRSFSNIWRVRTAEGTGRPLTTGDQQDRMPRWSPGGDRIAFVSDRGEGSFQKLWILPSDGGEAHPAGEVEGEIAGLDWGPDGRRIAVSFRQPDEREKRESEHLEADLEEPGATYREITRLRFREEERGFLPDEWFHIWIYDLQKDAWKQLTEGPYDDLQPAFSPGGDWVAFVANRIDEPDYDPNNSDVWLVDPESGDTRQLTQKRGPHLSPTWSPGGDQIAFVGHQGEPGTFMTEPLHCWIATPEGDVRPVNPDPDRTAMNLTLSDTKEFGDFGPPLLWREDPAGPRLLFPVSNEGSAELRETLVEEGTTKTVLSGDYELISFHGRPDLDTISCLISTPDQPVSLFTADVSEQELSETPAGINDDYASERSFLSPEHHRVSGEHDHEMDLWVLLPDEEPPDSGYPLVLQVHGGPHAQYGWTFFHEFQVLASNGYAVAYGNPRGSQGYDTDFVRSIRGDWGAPVFDDLMNMVDFAVSEYPVNEQAMGVAGGSYGGYMTNWVIGHTDRFEAAVTMRCVSNMFSMFGTSDFGYQMQWALEALPWENPERYRDLSPLTYLDQVNTPLLIIHSENDLRCPIGEAEQVYTYLKTMKKTVKMVRFEGETHGLSRQGRPLNREERLRQILDWFDSYLDPV